MERKDTSSNLVLIETLWNVKCVSHDVSFIVLRINRNIVECKDRYSHTEAHQKGSINRNIVECKA